MTTTSPHNEPSLWDGLEYFLMFISLLIMTSALTLTAGFYIDKWFSSNMLDVNYPASINSSWKYTLLKGYTAALIVSFPVFLFLLFQTARKIAKTPELKNLTTRRNLIYLTLIITFLIMIINLISLIFQFLNGNVTPNFLVHFFTIITINAVIFDYYLHEARENIKILGLKTRLFAGFFSATVITALILNFQSFGSPFDLQQLNQDNNLINRLNRINNYVKNYATLHRALPSSLQDLKKDNINLDNNLLNKTVEYKTTSPSSYELCSNFATSAQIVKSKSLLYTDFTDVNFNEHKKGRNCYYLKVPAFTSPSFPPTPYAISSTPAPTFVPIADYYTYQNPTANISGFLQGKAGEPLEFTAHFFDNDGDLVEGYIYWAPVIDGRQESVTLMRRDPISGSTSSLTAKQTFSKPGKYWVFTRVADAKGHICLGNPSYTLANLYAAEMTPCGKYSYISVEVKGLD